MHSLEIRTQAIALLRAGIPNIEVATQLCIPAGTIGAWKFQDRAVNRSLYRDLSPYAHFAQCPICLETDPRSPAYSYLLGQYLGDGHITAKRRRYSISISCCNDYPMIMDEVERALKIVLPGTSVSRVRRKGSTTVSSYSRHWTCLFPQHGPGRKHNRKIALAKWQVEIVELYPWEFIRGLIHSDGCRSINWTISTTGRRLEYPRYTFCNASADIRGLFCWALDLVHVDWRVMNAENISVAKKASVALMDLHVGPKS